MRRNRAGAEDKDAADSRRGGGSGHGCFFGAKETSTARKVDTMEWRAEAVGREHGGGAATAELGLLLCRRRRGEEGRDLCAV